MASSPLPSYAFAHAHGKPLHAAIGPWKVIGPGVDLTIRDRTEAALVTNALNKAFQTAFVMGMRDSL